VQLAHDPGGVLLERKIRVEAKEKVRVGEVVVTLDSSSLERPAG
jgi:hypothetical protein